MRWLSPKVLFDAIRQRLGVFGGVLGKIGGVLDMLRIWRRPKILAAVIGGVLLLGAVIVLILPTPNKVPMAGVNVTKANAGGKVTKAKKPKKTKTAAQKAAEAEAERKLRAELLADTKRIMAAADKKVEAARERQRRAELDRKLKWIAHGNGRFWKVTRLGFEGKPRAIKKEKMPERKSPEEDLFASKAFPLGADEEDGTYTIGEDPAAAMPAPEPGQKALPGKDWRKHIWKKKDSGKKKSKKKAKRKPKITPASYIYATIESSEKEMLALPPAVERVFRHSRRLLVDMDFSAEAVESWEKAVPVMDFISLTAIIRGNLFGAVERTAVRYRLSSARLDRLQPWAVARIFSFEPAEILRLRAGRQALPEALQIRANTRGMPVAALETVEQTVKVYADFTDPEQINLLARAVRMNRGVEKYRADMKAAYLAGETAKMLEMYRKWLAGYGRRLAEKIGPRFIEKRSSRMAANMATHLNRGKAFISVPALNMPGRNGVLRMLTRNGYRVRYVETDAKKPMLVASPKYVNSLFFGDTLEPKPRKKPVAKIAQKKKVMPKAGSKATAKPMAKRDPKKKQEAASTPE